MAPQVVSQLHAAKQRKNNHKLRRVVQPLAAFSAHEHDAVGRALLSVTGSTSTLDAPPPDGGTSVGMPATAAIIMMMSMEEALDRVAIWKLRSASLPHAVESTAALAEVLWRIQNTGVSSLASLLETKTTTLHHQHALACAVIRTVNGLADALQQQRAYAASVAILCRELGIPSWLVDIRHAATHNALPSLPVLTLAAQALLRYLQTVYWEPVTERRQEQYRHAVDLLRAYNHNNDRDLTSLSSNPQNKNASDANDNQDASLDNMMESSESDSEDLTALVQSMLPIPGTNGNRFALLLDDGKKNKAKRQAAAAALDAPVDCQHEKSMTTTPTTAAAAAAAPRRKKVKTDDNKQQRQYEVIKSTCAKLFIRSKLPLDIKYEAALDFFLNDNGVFLPPKTPPKDDKNSFCLADVQRHYETLLVTLGSAWPGFLSALLIRSVHLVLALAQDGPAADDDPSEYIVQFIQYWLSSSFVNLLVDPSATMPTAAKTRSRTSRKNEKHRSTLSELELAPWSILQAAPLQLPLNSLCDRCEAFLNAAAANRQYPSVTALKQLLQDILGDDRCANFGVADNTWMQPAMVSQEPNDHGVIRPGQPVTEKTKSATNGVLLPTAPQPGLSLEAMEAFLDEHGGGVNDQAHPSHPDNVSVASTNDNAHDPVSPTVAWVRCTSWEACSIGTLPGFGGCW